MMPPSPLPRWLRLKPVAIFCSRVAFGQQVAGDLLDGELVERHVAVEGVDHPVAPAPHRALAVALVAVGVGVAGGVEPAAGPCARRSAARPAADRRPSRRRRASDRRGTRRPRPASAADRSGRASRGGSACSRSASGGGLQALALQPAQDEVVDRIAAPAGGLHRWGAPGVWEESRPSVAATWRPARSSGGFDRSGRRSACGPRRPEASACPDRSP